MESGLVQILSFFAFGMGACIASFLNVVIWRVPRGESIVSPPSHCPTCDAEIKWYQNIPILAWLALRGKCANCKAPISPRYILIEALGGCLFLFAFWAFNPIEISPLGLTIWVPMLIKLLTVWIWIALMIVGSMIDFDHQLLPDFVTEGGMVLGVVSSLVKSLYACGTVGWKGEAFLPLAFSLIGLVFGFGLLGLVRWVGSKAFKREAMGLGDVYLMGAIGALFGPVAVLVTLILSAILGSLVGVTMILLSKARLGGFVEIPYGPYLCMGCLSWMFYGPELVDWYLNLLKL